MLPTKKIVVGLDGSEIDETLILFINYILRTSPLQKILFLNIVSGKEDLIDGLDSVNPENIELQKKHFQKQVNNLITTGTTATLKVDVLIGNHFSKMQATLLTEDIDIVVTGNKVNLKGDGSLNIKLARRAPCNIIVIPEGHQPELKKLLVPVDYSYQSANALNYALYVSKTTDYKVELVIQHVYEVKMGYSKTGKDYSEAAEVMKSNAEKQFKKWIKDFDIENVKINNEYSLNKTHDFGKLIKTTVESKQINGIIIGSMGRTRWSSYFAGSTAEDLIKAIHYLPLTIVRPKKSNIGVLASIREF